MKVYIACDLEGVAGVVSHAQQCQWDEDKGWDWSAPASDQKERRGWYAPYLEQARRLATEELNAAVQGALDGGASEAWAWNAHGAFPGGINVELLHPACQLVYAEEGGPAGLDETFAALFIIGQHAMAGAKWGRLVHSLHAGVVEISINGQPWGEIAATAWKAGQHGVPFAFLSGDHAACAEASALVPGVETAAVMRGLTEKPNLFEHAATVCLAPSKARERIREGARRAMARVAHSKPYSVPPPYAVRTTFESKVLADHAMRNYAGLERIDERTVAKTSDVLDLIL